MKLKNICIHSWILEESWTVEFRVAIEKDHHNEISGICDHQNKEIKISTYKNSDREIRKILIHELTHAYLDSSGYQRAVENIGDNDSKNLNEVIAYFTECYIDRIYNKTNDIMKDYTINKEDNDGLERRNKDNKR